MWQAASAIVGGFSVFGTLQAGKDQASAYNQQAYYSQLQALQLMQDFERNAVIERRQGEAAIKEQQGAYISSGVDIGYGSPLLAMEQANSALTEQISIERRNAMAKATQLRQQAEVYKQQGQAALSASESQAMSQSFSIFARAYGGGK